jgi:hypothetical protein
MKIKLIAFALLVLTACKKEITRPGRIVLKTRQAQVAKDLLKRDTGRFNQKFCEIIEKGNYPIVSSERFRQNALFKRVSSNSK